MMKPRAPHIDEERLHAYLDAELGPGERQALERHLAGCAACAEQLGELRGLWRELAALEDAPLERDLAPAVLAAIRPAAGQARRSLGKPRALRVLWLTQAAAAAALLLAFWLLPGADPAASLGRLAAPISSLGTINVGGAALLPTTPGGSALAGLDLSQFGAGLPAPALALGLAALAGCWALANALLLRPFAGRRGAGGMGHG